MSLSGSNALLFLQLLIALRIRSAVNVCAISIVFLLVSFIPNRVSLEEVCLPSFEVLNCWLNLAASCLDDENGIPFKVIAWFSPVRFSLPSIPLIVLHILVISVLVHGINKISPFLPLMYTDAFQSLFSLSSSGEMESLLWRSSRLFITSRIFAGRGSSWNLCRPVGMWCNATLSRIVQIYSHLFDSLLEGNTCSGWPPPLVCICHSLPSLG